MQLFGMIRKGDHHRPLLRRDNMISRHQRQRPISLLRRLLVLGAPAATITAASIGAQAAFAQGPAGVAACAKLATLSNFPVGATQITVAKFNAGGSTSASGVALPDHCQVQGIINKRVGVDGYPYGDSFEVRLPAPADWNGRFMFQGGGGTEGAVPPAVGIAGTLTPSLARGWAVASQDGGHENTDLPNPAQFFLDPQAIVDHAYRSIDVTTQTAKHLIDAFYGRKANRSYFVGCSTGGRQGMVMSQNFPDYYDGIIAGAPVYDIEAIALSGLWAASGKIIWYHGASDPLPPVAGTVAYFDALRAENGGATETEKFARLYLVPNMGHCRGGPGTDQFDLLTPLVAWVEQGTAPDRIIGSGTNFTSVPTTRNRPLCPYPQEARYTGPILGDLADASNYACVATK
jgi:predicted esterase